MGNNANSRQRPNNIAGPGAPATPVANGGNTFRVSRDADGPISGLKVFVGPFVHSLSRLDPCVIRAKGVIGVKDGNILFVDDAVNLESLKRTHAFQDNDIIVLRNGQFLMPGFVDTHMNASQYPNLGLSPDLPIREWLEKHCYPLEGQYRNARFAEEVYRKVVERTLSNGTTTVSYFATIHKDASLILADMVAVYGQRALIGKVCMDCFSPKEYCENTADSIADATDFVKAILAKKNPLVIPSITPRFALTCSEHLLKGLGDLAKEHDVHIQTHLCESLDEIAREKILFPDFNNYTHVYESHGLVNSKSVMAHCVHLSPDEISILKDRQAGVAHCPSSNMYKASGLCPVKKLMDAGLKVGLGTDVSGGSSSSILDEMRLAILTSKCLVMDGSDFEALSYKDVFYLATLGGAEALSLDKVIGNFKPGKSFDALLIDLASSGSVVDIFPDRSVHDLVQKFIMLGDDRNIIRVFVNGQIAKKFCNK